MLIDGKKIASEIKQNVIRDAEKFTRTHGRKAGLAVVLVGHDPASEIYVNNKRKASLEIGFEFFGYHLEPTIDETELCDLIKNLNADNSVDGILVQMPLPSHINPLRVMETIDPRKDVDGFTPINTGNLALGRDCIVPGTPLGCMELIKSVCQDMTGKHAVIVGRSNIVGKPLALLLNNHDCTVTICHSKTLNLSEHTRMADILIVAVGKKNLITADMVKPNSIVIDVGINRAPDGKLYGDVDFENVQNIAFHITPVPGGVGPMTMIMLFKNLLKLANNS